MRPFTRGGPGAVMMWELASCQMHGSWHRLGDYPSLEVAIEEIRALGRQSSKSIFRNEEGAAFFGARPSGSGGLTYQHCFCLRRDGSIVHFKDGFEVGTY